MLAASLTESAPGYASLGFPNPSHPPRPVRVQPGCVSWLLVKSPRWEKPRWMLWRRAPLSVGFRRCCVATRWCATSGLALSGPGQVSGWVNAFRRFTELKTAAAPYVVIRNNVTLDCYGTFDVRTEPAVVHGSSNGMQMLIRFPPTIVILSNATLTDHEDGQTVPASGRPDSDQDRGGSDRAGDHCECLRGRYPAASSGRIASRQQREVGKPHSVGQPSQVPWRSDQSVSHG
jgi:hypothetical protein